MIRAPRVGVEFAERALPDGLTALAVRNPGVRTMAVGAALHVGQLDEADGEFGLAYLLGALLEEGTQRLSAVGLAETVESIGASLSTNGAGGRILCPSDSVDAACALLRDVVLEPGFRPADVDRVKREIVAEIQADLEEPTTVASHRFRDEVYGRHPFARPAYGSQESIEALGSDDLHGFHAKWFRPGRGYVVIVGPFELEQSLDRLQRTFAEFRGERATVREFEPPPMPQVTREIHIPLERKQVHVFLGHPGVRRADPDWHELVVMDHVLGAGAGFTARIPQKLRDELGLCYSVGASITSSAGEEPGTFRAYIGTGPENRKLAVDGFLEEIRAIRREAPTEEELLTAQDYLAGGFVLGLERCANLMTFAIHAKRFDLGFDYVSEYPGKVRAVTTEDVRRVASERLHPDNVIVVSAGAGEG